jgi:hypothetical protein
MPNGLPVSTVELAGINGQKHDHQCGQEKHATHDFLATRLHCFSETKPSRLCARSRKGNRFEIKVDAAGRTPTPKREQQFGFTPSPSVGTTATGADLAQLSVDGGSMSVARVACRPKKSPGGRRGHAGAKVSHVKRGAAALPPLGAAYGGTCGGNPSGPMLVRTPQIRWRFLESNLSTRMTGSATIPK